MANRTRTHRWVIMLNEEENALALQKMNACRIKSKSVYARKMLCDGMIANVDYSAYKDLTFEIHKIGININQVVKRINETGNIYSGDIEELNKGIDNVWQQLRSVGLETVKKKV